MVISSSPAKGRILRHTGDGSFVTHTDLSALGQAWNEIVVDGRGNIYVNDVGFRFGQEQFRPGIIALVTPDGEARKAADNIAFPNGMVITPDNSTLIVAESFARTLTAFDIAPDGSLSNRRVWASDIGADGICLDADGAIWSPDIASGTPQVVRLREGGEVMQRMTLGAACFHAARLRLRIPVTVGGPGPFRGLHLDFSGDEWARLLFDSP